MLVSKFLHDVRAHPSLYVFLEVRNNRREFSQATFHLPLGQSRVAMYNRQISIHISSYNYKGRLLRYEEFY